MSKFRARARARAMASLEPLDLGVCLYIQRLCVNRSVHLIPINIFLGESLMHACMHATHNYFEPTIKTAFINILRDGRRWDINLITPILIYTLIWSYNCRWGGGGGGGYKYR